jgi:hypothetical protein
MARLRGRAPTVEESIVSKGCERRRRRRGRTGRVVTDRSKEIESSVGELESDVLPVGVKTLLHLRDTDLDDATDVLAGEAVVNNDRVDAVDELDGEGRAKSAVDELLGRLGDDVGVVREFVQVSRSDVRSHDDDGILEVDGSALRVGEPAVVHDAEEELVELASGLFDFLKVGRWRVSTHSLGENGHKKGEAREEDAHRPALRSTGASSRILSAVRLLRVRLQKGQSQYICRKSQGGE